MRAGLHLDALMSSPSSFLSVGAESAAILATLGASRGRSCKGDHGISLHQLQFESASTIELVRGLDATTRL